MRILVRNRKSEPWKTIEPIEARDEIELQKLLVNSPEILPSEDLDVNKFVASIPEFGLGTGAADILAFSVDGEIAIIECKRADNPDVKRKVIGQILEYASYLWGMSYEQLDAGVQKKQGKSLVELVKEKAEGEWDEENFREGIKNSLEKGEFFLIIAVDETNKELKRTIRYLNECGSPAYSLYALEMRLFKQDNIEVLIPHLYPEPPPPPTPPWWNWERFLQVIKENLSQEAVDVISQLYDWAETEEIRKLGGQVRFGKGKTYGTLNFCLKDIPTHIFSIWTSGLFILNYGLLSKHVSEEIMKKFHELHGINVPDDFSKYPSVKVEVFVGKPEVVEKFKEAIIWLANKVHSSI